jgi:hypothetical protein
VRTPERKSRLKLTLPANCSPQVRFSSAVDALSAAMGPLFSTTSTGTTRKLITVHAMPSNPETICPTFCERLSMIRRINPTVAHTSAHPAMTGRRAAAARSPSPTVGSPPRSRMTAQATMAALKKMMTK